MPTVAHTYSMPTICELNHGEGGHEAPFRRYFAVLKPGLGIELPLRYVASGLRRRQASAVGPGK